MPICARHTSGSLESQSRPLSGRYQRESDIDPAALITPIGKHASQRVVRLASLANTLGVQSWRPWVCVLASVAFRAVLASIPNPLIWGNIP
jgi:hypothetical protein